jgi:hypothetical protein
VCGITGIIERLDDRNMAALERMSDAMIHRGPDASGTWVSAPDSRGWGATGGPSALYPRHSPAGAQPMVDPVTGDVVVFNGEIYNFGDLRRRLVAEGQELRSTGDVLVNFAIAEALMLALLIGEGEPRANAGLASATVAPSRLPATRSNRLLSGLNPPPLAIRAGGAHCDIRVRRYDFCGDLLQ